MTAWLRRQGQEVNHKRVHRLMRLMGLETIYPKPRLSFSNQAHKKYPYLLRTLAKYFPFYDMERLHKSLGYQIPYEIYVKDRVNINPVQASTMRHIRPYFLS